MLVGKVVTFVFNSIKEKNAATYVKDLRLALASLQLRVAHKLTPQLRREVVLGSTNVDDPHQFIQVLVLSHQ